MEKQVQVLYSKKKLTEQERALRSRIPTLKTTEFSENQDPNSMEPPNT